VPETLIEEFREPTFATPAPTASAPAIIEDMHVPGSILDLRPPIAHAPARKPQVVVEPEPQAYVELASETYVEPAPEVYVEPEPPAYIVPEPLAYVEPVVQAYREPARPAFVEPQRAAPIFVEPERAAPVFAVPERTPFVEPELPVVVEPDTPAIVEPVAPISALKAVNAPEAPATATGTSASFEAALAAIRAAWAKPEPKASQPTTAEPKTPVLPAPATPVGGTKPLAGSGEVDLTNAIDALEDVTGVNGSLPAADDNDSPDESITPTERRKAEKPKQRQEQPRGSKTRGADGRDEWGVFDPNQCGFSALVNKLDEVTEDDVVTARATTIVR
jgi:hypothetical protein